MVDEGEWGKNTATTVENSHTTITFESIDPRYGSYTLIKGYIYMEELTTLVQQLETEVASYNAKPTKACSARIRKLTQRLNNIGPSIRKDLVAADKKGY